MTTDQRLILKSILLAWVLSGIAISAGIIFTRGQVANPLQALGFAFIPVGYSLAIGIFAAAHQRFMMNHIDGSRPAEGTSLDITLRYIQNTLEQAILFVIAAMSSSFIKPDIATPLLPVMGAWFFVARVLFWLGYVKQSIWRAVGFAATFHPTLLLLGATVILALGGLS